VHNAQNSYFISSPSDLDSEEMVSEYLTAAMEDENPDAFLSALSDAAKVPTALGTVTPQSKNATRRIFSC